MPVKRIIAISCTLCMPLVFAAWGAFAAKSQREVLDSLVRELPKFRNDTSKINLLSKIGYTCDVVSPDSAINFIKEEMALSQELGFRKGIADAHRQYGFYYRYKKDKSKALQSFLSSLDIYKALGVRNTKLVKAYTLVGEEYMAVGDYPKALEYDFEADKLLREFPDAELQTANAYGIGTIYSSQGDVEKAVFHLEIAARVAKREHNMEGYCGIINSIGANYKDGRKYDSAMHYFKMALAVADSLKQDNLLYVTYGNLGLLNTEMNDFENAMLYDKKCLDMAVRSRDSDVIGEIQSALAENILKNVKAHANAAPSWKKAQISEALGLLKSGLGLVRRSDNLSNIMAVEKLISGVYAQAGDYRNAWLSNEEYLKLRDSLASDDKRNQFAQVESKHDLELKNKQLQIDELSLAQKRTEGWFLTVAAVLMLAVIGFGVKNVRDQKRANRLLASEKEQIAVLKWEVEAKHGEMMESVTYSKRIQDALLPRPADIRTMFPQSFVYFRPRNIVSGDFYQFAQYGDRLLIAVADCTGHGVPGAFMTMIGHTLLNGILAADLKLQPGEILHRLDAAVSHTLHQDEDGASSADGMDIALLLLDPSAKTGAYAGANRPLYKVTRRDGGAVLQEVKPSKFPIGGSNLYSETKKNFDTVFFEYTEHDTFYLFTDGYADQFGGDKGKKMMTSRLKDLLLSMQATPLPEQEQQLQWHFEAWQGAHEQVDDVLVVGIGMGGMNVKFK